MKAIIQGVKLSHAQKQIKGDAVYYSALVDGLDENYTNLPISERLYLAIKDNQKIDKLSMNYYRGKSKNGTMFTMVSLDLLD